MRNPRSRHAAVLFAAAWAALWPAAAAAQAAFSCPGCDLRKAGLAGKNLAGANLAGANLAGVDLHGAVLDGTVLHGANLQKANLDGAVVGGGSKGAVDLSRADLSGASLKNAKVAGADLQFAALAGADFSGAELAGATFGVRINSGVLDGKRTSFRNATLRREFTADAAREDLEGVKWAPKVSSPRAGPAGVVCGKADLSKLESFIHVAPGGTDSDGCGASLAQACKTIAKGVARCAGAGCGVLVEWGEYAPAEPIRLRDGVNVYGGCLPADQAQGTHRSLVAAPAGGKPAMVADALANGAIVQGFKLAGSAAMGSDGAPSVTLQVVNRSTLSVIDSELLAGAGAAGAGGGGGAEGATGGAGNLRNGGTVSACPNTGGGAGAVKMNVDVHVRFSGSTCDKSCSENDCKGYPGAPGSTGKQAWGGKPSEGQCTGCTKANPLLSFFGGGGDAGPCGPGGKPSGDTAGTFSGVTWSGSTGSDAGGGGNGGGGGGGGAGGFIAGVCFWKGWGYPGSSGGGGGAGGCGGAPGGGGRQGGASLAAVAVASKLTLTGTRVVGGAGGPGGTGGTGGRGGAGGRGEDKAPQEGGSPGGRGGDGGPGGPGGGGAGGNGGPAIGVALAGAASVTGSGTVYYPGASGKVGGPGKGGELRALTCFPQDGSPGVEGLVADTHQF